jgi:2-keto-3-deoxy-L-rhamnonate aldolase RhmA
MHKIFEGLAGSNRFLVGGWISIGHESVVETMFAQGFDYVGIDTQHALLDLSTAGRLLHAVPKGGPAALIRTPSNNAADIGKAFDAGADGVIIPMVDTAKQAAAAVSACRYAPAGTRSFGPMRVAMPFDAAGLTARTACFVMAETQHAVDNIDAICATPELAGVYVGPADLAISLGLAVGLDVMPPPLLRAVHTIVQACRRAGIIAGGHFSNSQIGQLRALGMQMFTVGADRNYLAAGAKADLAVVRRAVEPG